MKKTEAHSLLFNSDEPYERIVVNFNSDAIEDDVAEEITSFLDSRQFGKNNRYSASLFRNTQWAYYMNKICSLKNISAQKVYLTALLIELNENYSKIRNDETVNGDLMNIINYINTHLTNELNLEKICNKFYISKPHLNKKFKKVVGTTVWEYITTKRLLLAKDLLRSGEHPTKVFLKSGFNDYCTFFRAYKAKFNNSPKNDFFKRF